MKVRKTSRQESQEAPTERKKVRGDPRRQVTIRSVVNAAPGSVEAAAKLCNRVRDAAHPNSVRHVIPAMGSVTDYARNPVIMNVSRL